MKRIYLARLKNKRIIMPIITVILFVSVSYLSKRYAPVLGEQALLAGPLGEAIYAGIMALAVIIAPFETLPLLPVAVALWGPNLAAGLTVVGWTLGSLIAFTLARVLGQRFVFRLADKYNIKEWAEAIPDKNIFWLVAFARFLLPVDIISYAVGLFTAMHWAPYLMATLVGVIPFAFIFAYGAELGVGFQAAIAVIIILILFFKYNAIRDFIRRYNPKYHSTK